MLSIQERFVYVINYDFCPSLNRWVLWITRPPVCLTLGAIACLLCAMFVNSNAYLLLGATSLVLGCGLVWPWISIAGLKCQLTFETQRSREGELSPMRITVTNRWPWPVFGISLLRGLGREVMTETGLSMIGIPGRSKAEFRWNFRAPHRGVFPIEGAWLETSFPFGLTRASRRVEVQSQLLVWPASVSLTTLPGVGVVEAMDDSRLNMRVGDQGDLLGTRGFRQGDSLRRVHWAQTARQQRMIVCERQSPERLAVRIHVDDAAEIHHARGTECTWEQSIRIVASLAESFQRMNVEAECHIGERLICLGHSPADLRRLLDLLAQLPTRPQLRPSACHGEHSSSSRRQASSRLDVRVTTQEGLTASTAPSKANVSMPSGRHVRSISRRQITRNNSELILAISLSSPESGRISEPEVASANSHSFGRCRQMAASADLLPEQLPRVWRSLCHASR